MQITFETNEQGEQIRVSKAGETVVRELVRVPPFAVSSKVAALKAAKDKGIKNDQDLYAAVAAILDFLMPGG